MSRVLSPREASEVIGRSEFTLCRWRREGSGPRFVRLAHNRPGYPLAELERWLSERTVDTGEVTR